MTTGPGPYQYSKLHRRFHSGRGHRDPTGRLAACGGDVLRDDEETSQEARSATMGQLINVSTRVTENTDIEMEREAAEKRLHKLWQFHDSQAWRGEVKVLLFGLPLVLVIFCMFYRLFCK